MGRAPRHVLEENVYKYVLRLYILYHINTILDINIDIKIFWALCVSLLKNIGFSK